MPEETPITPAAPAAPAAPAPVVSPTIVEDSGKKILALQRQISKLEKENQDVFAEKARLEGEIGALKQIPHPVKTGKTLWDEVEEFVWGKREG